MRNSFRVLHKGYFGSTIGVIIQSKRSIKSNAVIERVFCNNRGRMISSESNAVRLVQ